MWLKPAHRLLWLASNLQPLPWHRALPWLQGHQPHPEGEDRWSIFSQQLQLRSECLIQMDTNKIKTKWVEIKKQRNNQTTCKNANTVFASNSLLKVQEFDLQCFPWLRGHQQHPGVQRVHGVRGIQELQQLQQHPIGGSTEQKYGS